MSREDKSGTNCAPLTANNPFSQIAAPPPAFSEAWAGEFAMLHYGISAQAAPLVSERDQNFLLKSAARPLGILKVANAAEPAAVTQFQIDALRHVAAVDADFDRVPRVLPTRTGRYSIEAAAGEDVHVVRLVSYLSGMPAVDLQRDDWPFARSLGETLARLNLALRGFAPARQTQTLLWDMQRALALRELLGDVDEADARALLARTLDDFERIALPAFDTLPRQVIHNDANPANVLLAKEQPSAVSGLIDFGDMIEAPRIVELAVAGAYLRAFDDDPLAAICELLAGYCQLSSLEFAEIEILPALIRTRLATTIAILHWRQSLRAADDDYLRASHATEGSALRFLECLSRVSDADAVRAFSNACQPES